MILKKKDEHDRHFTIEVNNAVSIDLFDSDMNIIWLNWHLTHNLNLKRKPD